MNKCENPKCDNGMILGAYPYPCPDCNGAGIQPEPTIKKSLTVEKSIDEEIRAAFEKDLVLSVETESLYSMNNNYEQNWDSFDLLEKNTVPMKDLVHSIVYDFNEAAQKYQKEIVTLNHKIVLHKSRETHLLEKIEKMKCCGNCDQENLQSDCLISETDIRQHKYICDNWKPKDNTQT